MKGLLIWQANPSNPSLPFCIGLEQLGCTMHVCTNMEPYTLQPRRAPLEHQAADPHFPRPLFDMPVTSEMLRHFEAEKKVRPDTTGDYYTHREYLLPWSWIMERWSKVEDQAPDFCLVWEGHMCAGGEKPELLRDVPILYYAGDSHRGTDYQMRQAYACGATHILTRGRWFMPYFQMHRHIGPIQSTGIAQSGCYFEKVLWLPGCVDPDIFRKYPDEPKLYDVLFMGTCALKWTRPNGPFDGYWNTPPEVDGDGAYIWDADCKIEADIYNYGEMRQRSVLFKHLMEEKAFRFQYRPDVHGEAYAKELARAKIVWNCHGGYDPGHNPPAHRIFEVTGVGSVLMTNDTDDTPALYEPDKEIVTYPLSYCPWHTMFEWMDYGLLRDKILDLLQSPAKLEEIAVGGLARTQKDHMPIHRAQRILDIVQGKDVDPYNLQTL